jgi:glycosyltransferase involved in cell wall biosynthesis
MEINLFDKKLWPWINISDQIENYSDLNWPKISIVTPSFNQGAYIERTILSILNQNYPNIEYIIIDGGSVDNTVEIIEKYSDKISYWVSEKDSGQSNAINKGFRISSGEIVAWLNSDDFYTAGILKKIATIFLENEKANIISCQTIRIDESGNFIRQADVPSTSFNDIFFWNYHLPQPGTFFKKKLIEKVNYLDENLHFSMDYDLWFKFAKETDFLIREEIAAIELLHSKTKNLDKKNEMNIKIEHLFVQMRHADSDALMKKLIEHNLRGMNKPISFLNKARKFFSNLL